MTTHRDPSSYLEEIRELRRKLRLLQKDLVLKENEVEYWKAQNYRRFNNLSRSKK